MSFISLSIRSFSNGRFGVRLVLPWLRRNDVDGMATALELPRWRVAACTACGPACWVPSHPDRPPIFGFYLRRKINSHERLGCREAREAASEARDAGRHVVVGTT